MKREYIINFIPVIALALIYFLTPYLGYPLASYRATACLWLSGTCIFPQGIYFPIVKLWYPHKSGNYMLTVYKRRLAIFIAIICAGLVFVSFIYANHVIHAEIVGAIISAFIIIVVSSITIGKIQEIGYLD